MKNMNLEDKLSNALSSSARFFIIEGNEQKNYERISRFYQEKEMLLSFIEGEELKAENARALVSELSKKSIQDEVIVINRFEEVGEVSQNILLKSLENMSAQKTIIALCSHTFGILETIISRAYHLFLGEQSEDSLKLDYLLSPNHSKVEKITWFSNLEDDALQYNNLLETSGENIIKNLKLSREVLQYLRRVEANCNKELCADLLLYRILEEQ